jgi:hypothetical protein
VVRKNAVKPAVSLSPPGPVYDTAVVLLRRALSARATLLSSGAPERALTAQGSSLLEIARHTGLPMNAVARLLAVTDTSAQLPPSGNRN